jgi:hypothetical protein
MEDDTWYCAVKARKWKTKRAGKVVVPAFYTKDTANGRVGPVQLWGQKEEVIEEYIKSEAKIKEAEKALRFSWDKDDDLILQMAIPTAMVDKAPTSSFKRFIPFASRSELDLWAQCWETEEELHQFSDDVIAWEKWDVKGDIQA